MVIPKEHGEKLHNISDSALNELLIVAKNIALKAFSGLDYNLLQNNGVLAHQEVNHVHFHLIPKRNSDEGLQLDWVTQKISMEKLESFANETAFKE